MISPVKIWRNQKITQKLLNLEGEVITWTVVRVPPGTHTSYAPYVLALIKLSTGKQITVPIVDTAFDTISFGMKVKTVLRRMSHPDSDGVIHYGIKAIPLL
jgi:uncharacterized OB-fold protein